MLMASRAGSTRNRPVVDQIKADTLRYGDGIGDRFVRLSVADVQREPAWRQLDQEIALQPEPALGWVGSRQPLSGPTPSD